jgi:hypothetical protein
MFSFGIVKTIGNLLLKPIELYADSKRVEAKRQEAEVKFNQKIALKRLEIEQALAEQGVQATTAWDMQALKNMNGSWKDEYLLILMTLPVLLVFFPSLSNDIKAGFSVLSDLPSWYVGGLIGIISATFGLRWMKLK